MPENRPNENRGDRPAEKNKSGVDKVIDKAQEKGVFDKAAKAVQDRMKGNKGR